jgi:hypothetical protein
MTNDITRRNYQVPSKQIKKLNNGDWIMSLLFLSNR